MNIVQFHSDLTKLIEVLPPKITKNIPEKSKLYDVIELVLDYGRLPEIRHGNHEIEYLGDDLIEREDLDYIVNHIPEFTHDNRSGIPGTLHRISAIRNRQGAVVGLTLRIGRIVTGTIECIKDIVLTEKSILFLGKPGVGKTTKLREISRLLADELHKRVVVVDTSNEIAGDGDTPHPAIGHARRMQVKQPEFQKDIMIEAVENHTPEVIVVDEIGTEAEAQAARTIAERGVMLIATAHGNCLENLIKNPVLSDLVGSVQSVTLGDDEARRRASQKTVLEREKQPTFDVVIEILDRNTLAVYKDTAEAVDYILRGWPIKPEIRHIIMPEDSETKKETVEEKPQISEPVKEVEKSDDKTISPQDSLKFSFSRKEFAKQVKNFKKLYIYAVSRNIVETAIERLNLNCELTRNIDDADIVIAHKSFSKGQNKVLSIANDYRLPVYFVRTNSMPQIQKVLKDALQMPETDEDATFIDATEIALDEAKKAIEKIQNGEKEVALAPQNLTIRKLQHELADQYGLRSESFGDDDERHLVIYKD